MTVVSFSGILQHLDEFFAICRTLGREGRSKREPIRHLRDRIQHLSTEIGRLRAGEAAPPIYASLAAELPKYLVALAESEEVGAMVPFLQTCPPQVLSPRLKAVLAGPEFPSDEDQASNQARNIQFELWLANVLWRAGASVALGEPDLQCKISDATILVACKRIVSVWKLTKRINEATSQLQRGLASVPERPAAGIIAVSLSRILAVTDRSEQIANRGEGLERLESRIGNLVERRAKWRQTREAQGIVFHAASMFTNAESNRIESGSFIILYGDGPVCGALANRLYSVAVKSSSAPPDSARPNA